MIGLLMLMGIALALLVMLLTAMLTWQMVHPPRHTLGWAMARKIPADPGELGLTFEEWWLERPGGVRLPVWEIDVRGQKSEVRDQPGVTAVFVHGWGHSRIDSLQRIGPFVPLVDRIVLYDLRGHGESTGGASRLGDGEDDDLFALLERVDGSGASFLIVGHSMGAVIALGAAVRAGGQRSEVRGQPTSAGRIAGVIAYAPYCDFHRSLQGRLRVKGLPSRPISDLAMLAHRARGVRPTSLGLAEVATIHLPLLVIHGVEDAVAPVDDSRRIVDRVRAATLIEIDDAAHADAHHVDKATHDEAVRGFIERVRGIGIMPAASLK